jgi:hypothetical protein
MPIRPDEASIFLLGSRALSCSFRASEHTNPPEFAPSVDLA